MGDVGSKIETYYSERLREHGPTPRGVDWNSSESQELRFDQLLRALPDGPATLLDYGCGYGALVPYLHERRPDVRYVGYDLSRSMIEAARELHPGATFISDPAHLERADVVVASGIFSVKRDVSNDDWEIYIFDTLDRIAELAKQAFSFNMLTAYSDPDRMRPDLYYADPHRMFDWCRTRYSRWVAMLHDYGLYEFATIVRRHAA